jgi:hypothetical protein
MLEKRFLSIFDAETESQFVFIMELALGPDSMATGTYSMTRSRE